MNGSGLSVLEFSCVLKEIPKIPISVPSNHSNISIEIEKRLKRKNAQEIDFYVLQRCSMDYIVDTSEIKEINILHTY